MTLRDLRRGLSCSTLAASLTVAACGPQRGGGPSDDAPTASAASTQATTAADTRSPTSEDPVDSDATAASTTTSSSSSVSAGATGESTVSDSGSAVPCEERVPPDCNENDQCNQFILRNVTRDQDICTFGEPFEVCANRHPSGGCTATPGCAPCARRVYYRPAAEGIDIGSKCSPEPPSPGYTFCESGWASDADPPECACMCELAEDCQPEPGTSSG